jgi:hypothetical protein
VESKVRPKLTTADKDKFVAIDIETGEYELDKNEMRAANRLRRRIPDVQIWLVHLTSGYLHGLSKLRSRPPEVASMGATGVSVTLIRIGLRDKLPRGLSHPVGAEAISQALSGCPRYNELWTTFGSNPLPVHPAPGGAADFRLAFAVVCNNRAGNWYLSVPAVPSEERLTVRQLLVATGLAAAREWLCRTRPATWYEGFRTFQVGYTVEPLGLCFVESLNHRVIDSSVAAIEDVRANPKI